MGRFSLLTLLAIIYTLTTTAFAINGDLGVSKGANGTESSPWLIEDFADFDTFCNEIYGLEFENAYWEAGVYTKLMTDLDLNPDLPERHIYSGAPVGSIFCRAENEIPPPYIYTGIAYSGHFDGNGHVLSNPIINACSHGGFFAFLEQGASIINLGIENITLNASDSYSGGLCGFNYGGIISNCYTTGSIIISKRFRSSVSFGGLCGYNYGGTITNCHSTCTINSQSKVVGGLCGMNAFDGTINNSYATGSVTISNIYAGGLCGINVGIISNCYATGAVTGEKYVGGLCATHGYNGVITNSYATGQVNGEELVGGFCGTNIGIITDCYCSGKVNGAIVIAGFCAYNPHPDSIMNSFWNTNTSGIADPEANIPDTDGIIGITTTEMQTKATFIDASWDFNTETTNGTNDIWHMPYGSTGYPMLFWQKDIPSDTTGSYGIDIEDFSILSKEWQIEYSIADLSTLASYWLEGK